MDSKSRPRTESKCLQIREAKKVISPNKESYTHHRYECTLQPYIIFFRPTSNLFCIGKCEIDIVVFERQYYGNLRRKLIRERFIGRRPSKKKILFIQLSRAVGIESREKPRKFSSRYALKLYDKTRSIDESDENNLRDCVKTGPLHFPVNFRTENRTASSRMSNGSRIHNLFPSLEKPVHHVCCRICVRTEIVCDEMENSDSRMRNNYCV